MVAEKKMCDDSGLVSGGGDGFTLQECAKDCSWKTSMFKFGRKDGPFGTYCNSRGCTCYCLPDSRADGTCRNGRMLNHGGYDLYAFV